jgi:hypothetical protein
MRRLLLGVVVAVALLDLACQPGQRRVEVAGEGDQEHASLNANAGCYVCHMTFVKEPLVTTHLKKQITCARCHGASIAHANDENVGATLPDIVIKRDQVTASCRTCHRIPDGHPKGFFARLFGSKQTGPGAEPVVPAAVCTDCHGKHKIGKT